MPVPIRSPSLSRSIRSWRQRGLPGVVPYRFWTPLRRCRQERAPLSSAPSSDSWTPITQTDWQDLTYARDYYFLTGSGASSGEGEVAFAGYGLDVDARRDYARLNVKDRIVLAFEGAPTGLDLQPTQRSTFTKARTAKERGARGLLLVQTALEAPLPRDRIWVLRPENLLEGFMLGRVSPGVAGVLAGMEPAALRQRADDPGRRGRHASSRNRVASVSGLRSRTGRSQRARVTDRA